MGSQEVRVRVGGERSGQQLEAYRAEENAAFPLEATAVSVYVSVCVAGEGEQIYWPHGTTVVTECLLI